MEGCVVLDRLPNVRRNYSLFSYKLDVVARRFLGTGKDPLDAAGIFRCYDLGVGKLRKTVSDAKAREAISIVGKYCVQENVQDLQDAVF